MYAKHIEILGGIFMSQRRYSEEEKQAYIEEFNKSGESIGYFAMENNIPQSTLRGWIDAEVAFGKISMKQVRTSPHKANKNMVFACENIRIELKENFNKELLKKVMEVLIDA